MSLKINNISKKYFKEKKYVLNNLSLEIKKNTINSIVGINGSGKSTLIKSILELININSGMIEYDDKPIKYLIKMDKVGYMPEFLEFSKSVKLYNYLKDMSIIKGMNKTKAQERTDELLKIFDLYEYKNQFIFKFSKGMKKKVGFIQSILNNPELLILDEPTDGLDPMSRRKMLNHIKQLSNQNCTILITSHILADLELVSDNVFVLSNGQIMDEISRNKFIDNKIDMEIVFSDKQIERFRLNSNNNNYIIKCSDSANIDEIKINSSYIGLEDLFMNSLQRNRSE